jgi:hypothetical protein
MVRCRRVIMERCDLAMIPTKMHHRSFTLRAIFRHSTSNCLHHKTGLSLTRHRPTCWVRFPHLNPARHAPKTLAFIQQRPVGLQSREPGAATLSASEDRFRRSRHTTASSQASRCRQDSRRPRRLRSNLGFQMV